MSIDELVVLRLALDDRIRYLRKLNIPDTDPLIRECEALKVKV